VGETRQVGRNGVRKEKGWEAIHPIVAREREAGNRFSYFSNFNSNSNQMKLNEFIFKEKLKHNK
jgi:hypothetical protein